MVRGVRGATTFCSTGWPCIPEKIWQKPNCQRQAFEITIEGEVRNGPTN